MTMMALVSSAVNTAVNPMRFFGKSVSTEGFINSDYIKSGTMHFDPYTCTVTLKDAVIEYDDTWPIIDDQQNQKYVTIIVDGTCSISCINTFVTSEDISIRGVGYTARLNVNISGNGYVICTQNNVTISQCLVKATTNGQSGICSGQASYQSIPNSYLYLDRCRLFITAARDAIFFFRKIDYTQTKMTVPDPSTIMLVNSSYYLYNNTLERVPKMEFEQCSASEAITFEDPEVERICVAKWDTNQDNKLSYAEAAAVKSLGGVFRSNSTITAFNELIYFTGLTEIGTMDFAGCINLARVRIPKQITTIGSNAFMNTESLRLVKFEYMSELRVIGNRAFTNSAISSLSGLDHLVTIDQRAFRGCTKLTSVSMPSTLKTIAQEAFSGCSKLNIVMSRTVESIGDNAFYGCTSMTASQLIGKKDTQVSIGKNAFSGSGLKSLTIGTKNFTLSPEFGFGASADFYCYIDHSIYNAYIASCNTQWTAEMVRPLKPCTLLPDGEQYRTFYFYKDVKLRNANAYAYIITSYANYHSTTGFLHYERLTDGIVPANTPVMLHNKYSTSTIYYDIIEEGTMDVTPVNKVNYLIGTDKDLTVAPSSPIENRLVWKSDKFLFVENVSEEEKLLEAGSAYLQLPLLKDDFVDFKLYSSYSTGGQKLSFKGDVDGNGVINKDDVTALVNVLLGLAVHPLKQCDMDENNTVNMADLTALILLLNQNK